MRPAIGALVAAAAVLLVLGFVPGPLGFVYVALLTAGVAGFVSAFAVVARRRSPARASDRSTGAGEGPGPNRPKN